MGPSVTIPDMSAPARPLRRDTEHAIVGGVLAGIGRRANIDARLVRVAFVVLVFATSGVALLTYAVAAAMIPADADRKAEPTRIEQWLQGISRPRRWPFAIGVGLLTLATLLVFRELGIWWSDAVIWPLVLAASGAALLWRQSRVMQPGPEAVVAPSEVIAPDTAPPRPRGAGAADLYRGGFGIALVLGAGLLFLSATGALGGAREVILVAIAATAALALILAPFLWRLGRNLAAERAERIRSQERAEMAAHLHDSVLQTLTLVQKRSGDPREVAQLARRQERELRSWLFDGEANGTGNSLAAALQAAAVEIEDAHGVPIDVIAVGDRPLDERSAAIVAAAREAVTNAAKFAPDSGPVAVYAELGEEGAQVFIRDRGPGFDPEAIPADRRGLRESIVGRMERFGGQAAVRSAPGGGTEIELRLNQEPS
jgi:signal transduction histidine kinase